MAAESAAFAAAAETLIINNHFQRSGDKAIDDKLIYVYDDHSKIISFNVLTL